MGSNTWPSQFVGRDGPCAPAERAAASERINWPGNTELRAIRESFGIMANYLYDHDSIEDSTGRLSQPDEITQLILEAAGQRP